MSFWNPQPKKPIWTLMKLKMTLGKTWPPRGHGSNIKPLIGQITKMLFLKSLIQKYDKTVTLGKVSKVTLSKVWPTRGHRC